MPDSEYTDSGCIGCSAVFVVHLVANRPQLNQASISFSCAFVFSAIGSFSLVNSSTDQLFTQHLKLRTPVLLSTVRIITTIFMFIRSDRHGGAITLALQTAFINAFAYQII